MNDGGSRTGNPLIDLTVLRNEVAVDFNEWREATTAFFDAADRASKARYQIAAKARQLLLRISSLSDPGLYLFLCSRASDIGEAVVYVGLVKARAGSNRMLDYLAKQLSLLDPSLLLLDQSQAEYEVERRVRASMRSSSDETIKSYLPGQMKSVRLARADNILFHPTQAIPEKIEAAETLLIRSMVEMTGTLDKLVNRAKTKGPWPPRLATVELGEREALAALESWVDSGFDPAMAENWRATITSVC